jgi:hypothetical protein
VYTITIHAAGGTVVVRGESRPGETWQQALLRLYHATLPPEVAPRCVVYATRRHGQAGSATNSVVLGYMGPAGRLLTDPNLFIHTDPPQF